MGENHFTALPTALYGVVLLMAAIAYWLLQQTIIRVRRPDSILKTALGGDWKESSRPLLYLAGDRLRPSGAMDSHRRSTLLRR